MAEYLNAECSICGKKYHVCGTCKQTKTFTPWRRITDSVNCYKIFIALTEYQNGHTDKKTTKEVLEKCDLSGLAGMKPGVQDTIKNIL